ncbi:phosphonate ABC transporter ATP-binding protein [Paenibacillus wulumuqiensis]|uniref:phosphonate ABC transporter ATP-binding protein n=1 Tax=Paenibacillus wulumuqiensis TaxID=1567107 RepID=UPI000619ABD9|nr:ATP-binding cassette domain-containing protein [Paenibacillus wulumuqiensis]
MIHVDHLTKIVGEDRTRVLDDINLEIQHGEMIALVGPSGSGKSMLLKCLAMRETWTEGSFRVGDTDIHKSGFSGKRKISREWSFLEQSPQLHPERTALKTVLIGQSGQTPVWRMLTGMVRSDDYMGAMDILETLGLLDKAHQKAGTLSGGERQRVAIARALAHGAKVVLADEPVTGLDPKSGEEVIKTLRALCTSERLTVIAVIPLELAERYATRIIGLQEGRISFDINGRRLTSAERRLL